VSEEELSMAGKLPKNPGRAWRDVLAAVGNAMAVMDFQDVAELRSELVKYQRNLASPPAERLPHSDRYSQLCAEAWDALLGMGYENPLDVLDKVIEEFGPRPDLDAMQRAVGRYDKRGSWTG
jgi:hypothetical protein